MFQNAFHLKYYLFLLPIIFGAVYSCSLEMSDLPQISDPQTVKGRDCEVPSDCDLGNLCENGHCVPGCRKNEDCSDGMMCEEKQCIEKDDDDNPFDDDDNDDNNAVIDDDDNDDDTDDDDNDDLSDAGEGDDDDTDDDDTDDTDDDDSDAGPAKCERDAECPLGYYCNENGECKFDCTRPADCAAGYICDSSGRCVAEVTDAGEEDTGPDDAGEEDAGDEDAGGAALLDLKGFFGLKIEIHSDVKASWVSASNVVSYQYLVFHVLTQQDKFIETKSKYCKMELPKVDKTETTIRQEAIDSIPVAHEFGEYLDSPYFGATYTPPARAEVMGAELPDPFSDPLPKHAEGFFSDSCPDGSKPKEVKFRSRKAKICWSDKLRDTDADSVPGITAHLTNVAWPIDGDVDGFIDLKNILQMRGTVEDNSTIFGEVMPNMETKTLALDHWLQDVASVTPEITIRQGENTFKMFRIDGRHNSPDFDTNKDGVIDCKEFMDQKEKIGF